MERIAECVIERDFNIDLKTYLIKGLMMLVFKRIKVNLHNF
jgi:hypothetical protein